MKKSRLPILGALMIAVLTGSVWAGIQAPAEAPGGMVLIPGGEYWMGRTHFFLIDEVGWAERDRRDDTPAHKVHVDPFYMDQYEVTNEDYAKFVEATGATKPWYWRDGKILSGEERFPLHDVNWHEAEAYCRAAGKRLPTEAEWERAARGGLDREKFSWGDGTLGMGGYDAEPAGEATAKKPAHAGYPWGPAKVGSYPPNAYGLYDIIGNVWEWTGDWYARNYYSVTPARNPQGPATGQYRVIRVGGCSDDDERNLMNHYRNYSDPQARAFTIGFRCVKSAASPGSANP